MAGRSPLQTRPRKTRQLRGMINTAWKYLTSCRSTTLQDGLRTALKGRCAIMQGTRIALSYFNFETLFNIRGQELRLYCAKLI